MFEARQEMYALEDDISIRFQVSIDKRLMLYQELDDPEPRFPYSPAQWSRISRRVSPTTIPAHHALVPRSHALQTSSQSLHSTVTAPTLYSA